jgi:methylenetetrahydrofolate reductase (NADPH)
LDACDRAGITCPIIPGLLPIHNYERFVKFTNFLQIEIPKSITSKLEAMKHNDSDVIDYGIELGIKMSEDLLALGAPGVHYYTLNLETSVRRILEGLGWIEDCRERRSLPWRKPTTTEREQESVRPIFWSNRPKSYLTRTREWDDFPNGRWGDSRSPSFGALDHYYLISHAHRNTKYRAKCLEQWGHPESIDAVAEVFSDFCRGRINRLPWCEMPVQNETSLITEQLVDINKRGYFTINSQPQINAAPSADPDVGWGGPGGFIYQKAYLEFFTSKENLKSLLTKVDCHASITLQAVNKAGDSMGNMDDGVNAVTWGVFPGKEIIQPTVVDIESFMIWKDEAFELWRSAWMTLYSQDSQAHGLLEDIMENYYLVNLVENDYVNGNIFSLF